MVAASARGPEDQRITPKDLEDEDRFSFDEIIGMFDKVIRVNFVDRPGARKNLMALLGTMGELFPGLMEGDAKEPKPSKTLNKTPK